MKPGCCSEWLARFQFVTYRSLREGVLGAVTATLGGTGFARGFSALSFVGVASLVSPDVLGRFSLSLAAVGVIAAVCLLGIPSIANQRIAAEIRPARAARIGSRAIVALLVWSALVAASGLLVLGLGDLSWSGGHPALLVFWSVGSACNVLLAALLQGNQAYRGASLLSAVRALAVGGVTLSIAVSRPTSVPLELGAACSEVAVAIAAAVIAGRRGYLTRNLGAIGLRSSLQLVRSVGLSGMGGILILVGVWLLQYLLSQGPSGFADNASFAISQRIALFGMIIPSAIAIVATPAVASRLAHDRRLGILRYLPLLAFVPACVYALVVGVNAEIILQMIAAPYGQAVWTLRIAVLLGVFIALNNVLGGLALGLSMYRTWIASDWILGLSMVVLGITLIGTWPTGPTGAAIAWGASYVLSVIFLAPMVLARLRSA